MQHLTAQVRHRRAECPGSLQRPFNALRPPRRQGRRDIAGVSQKVLSQPLKKLERDGLVERQVHPTVPPTVEYALTELGATLGSTVEQPAHWAESNMPAIVQARQRYDMKPDPGSSRNAFPL
ncbi:helix-turn-helix transcriptional regulator [Pseudomonas mosselii]|uniref:Helix-turn-helix transcriptional regulator n=1 Tax=Pseudomonas mosselii TaxID=78327 RepID=A0A7W2Q0C0_9PSED|nr:helix-turn-helix domain-containing protein [Pseudomonas mosselii]MBA6067385.1 helix-turn-helix transcriptional regulator [Pseudomonas mosselii]MBC3459090.1 helix-turn-helix transcriptional regulator [Pseudomonas mosselii]